MGTLTNFFGGYLVKRFGLIPILYWINYTDTKPNRIGCSTNGFGNHTFSIFCDDSTRIFWCCQRLNESISKICRKNLAPKTSNNTLFKWVAILTGSKNAIKGLGFLSGAVLLAFLTMLRL